MYTLRARLRLIIFRPSAADVAPTVSCLLDLLDLLLLGSRQMGWAGSNSDVALCLD